jgi:5-methylcytosine-specific restriction endonuclease McrA
VVKRNIANQMRMRAIVKRSKPACHICGGVIAFDAPHTDPKSFVIDHVVSLNKGGEDALSNVRAAHRRQTVNATPRRETETTRP